MKTNTLTQLYLHLYEQLAEGGGRYDPSELYPTPVDLKTQLTHHSIPLDLVDAFGPIRYSCPKSCTKCKGEGCIVR